jgi:hypothetical protein
MLIELRQQICEKIERLDTKPEEEPGKTKNEVEGRKTEWVQQSKKLDAEKKKNKKVNSAV